MSACLGFWGRGRALSGSVLVVACVAACCCDSRAAARQFFAGVWFRVGVSMPLEFGALTRLQGHSFMHLRERFWAFFHGCSGYIRHLFVVRCFAYRVRLVRVLPNNICRFKKDKKIAPICIILSCILV